MASSQQTLAMGALGSTLEVVVFVVLTGMAWFNGAELLVTILLTFKRWSGKYFYCLLVATLGVLVYQINVFLMIFAPYLNAHGVIACIGIGWSSMVTGQSLVLWSRLHLVCRSTWKLRTMLAMIIVNGISMHGSQFIFSLLAVKNNAIDPAYKPFEVMEKISLVILTSQEIIISLVYLFAAVRILRIGESIQRKGNRRRTKLLFLANVLIICVDICTVTLEFMALWGVWCSFKGFGYSVKLKVEFAILNQLRDSVKGNSGGSYDYQERSKPASFPLHKRSDHTAKASGQPGRLATKFQNFEQIPDAGVIERKTEIVISHEEEAILNEVQRIDRDSQCSNTEGAASVSSYGTEFAARVR